MNSSANRRIDTLTMSPKWHWQRQSVDQAVNSGQPSRSLTASIVLLTLYLVATISFLAVLGTLASPLTFPSFWVVLFVGTMLGQLLTTQAWPVGQRWTTLVRLLLGIVAIQWASPFLANQLGGPTDQWWSALTLMLLTFQAVSAVLSGTPSDSARHAGWYSMADLLALATLMTLVIQLSQYARLFPEVLLQSFAWFGGFATLIGITRFGLSQALQLWTRSADQRNSAARRVRVRWQQPCCLLESAGILIILAGLDGVILTALHWSRGDSARTQGLFLLLLIAQLWQVVDLAMLQVILGMKSSPRTVSATHH